MISFMLQNVTYMSVLIAALVGWGICMLAHVLFPCHHECKAGWGCGCMSSSNMGYQDNKNQNCGTCCHDHCHHGFLWMIVRKVGKFGILLLQAYGLAFILERFMVLGSYRDAIMLALFIAGVFVVSHVFSAVLNHYKSVRGFILKALHILLAFAGMAAVFVYMAA